MDEQPLKILMLDDDEEEFLIVKRLVGRVRHRFALDWTPDPVRALEDMCSGDHDVYLVDYRLGAISGVEVIRSAVDSGVKAPLILLTGTVVAPDDEVDI